MAVGLYDGGRIAAAVPALFKDGAGCGACYQMSCKDPSMCKKEGTTVMVTDLNTNNQTDFVISSRAFMAMAKQGNEQHLLKLGILEVDYKRVACDYYKNKNLAIRVEESSQKHNNYLAIKFLYQAGQTEIVSVDVAQVGESSSWSFMTRKHSAVWETSQAPSGALQFRLVVTAGYDGKWYWAKKVLPSNWQNGVTYDSGLQITDTAQEAGCSPCDASPATAAFVQN
ncbi:unnamed protein product [Cuscuta europaea]|uniref:Expansin-like A2 n=1 Tax=Cuscuta europaea TaxID=41803 RepID=A0A9P0YI04_CUSEU|nr:unnamed protein product [Cuscuta europaea]